MEKLYRLLNAIKPLSEDLKNFLSQNLQIKSFQKGDYILREGQVCNKAYFINKGLVYALYTLEKDDKLQEVCNWIYQENDVIISVYSFYQQVPSYENLVCLNDTEVVFIDYKVLQEAYNKFPEWNYTIRILVEKYYVDAEVRLFHLRKRTAEDRYHLFLSQFGHLLADIPDKLVASYIGVDKATFSRMKRK